MVGRSGYDRVTIGPRSNRDLEPRSWLNPNPCRPMKWKRSAVDSAMKELQFGVNHGFDLVLNHPGSQA